MSSGIILSSNSRSEKLPQRTRGFGTLRIAAFAWATLACNVAVILWGAYVRATGSGAGCGNRWPICGGTVLGANAQTPTIIEFTHRLTSGIALLMVGSLAIWCWRVTKKSDWARYSAALAAVFLVNEALLGAALVLLGHVAQDKSSGRILFLCLHFGNTLLLLATLTLTARWLQIVNSNLKVHARPREVIAIGAGLLATMIIGITGAVAALADTIFPATSLRTAWAEEFSSSAPVLLHLRLLHPAVAVIASAYVLWIILKIAHRHTGRSRTAIALVFLFGAQIGLGIMNVLLLAPVWLQILHLCIADLLWIVLVLASADLLLESADTAAVVAGRA